jgi:hypothetical protein
MHQQALAVVKEQIKRKGEMRKNLLTMSTFVTLSVRQSRDLKKPEFSTKN